MTFNLSAMLRRLSAIGRYQSAVGRHLSSKGRNLSAGQSGPISNRAAPVIKGKTPQQYGRHLSARVHHRSGRGASPISKGVGIYQEEMRHLSAIWRCQLAGWVSPVSGRGNSRPADYRMAVGLGAPLEPEAYSVTSGTPSEHAT